MDGRTLTIAQAIDAGQESIEIDGRTLDLRPALAHVQEVIDLSHQINYCDPADVCMACGGPVPDGGCRWAESVDVAQDWF